MWPTNRRSPMIQCGKTEIHVDDAALGTLRIASRAWQGFGLAPLAPSIQLDGQDMDPSACRLKRVTESSPLEAQYAFGERFTLKVEFSPAGTNGIVMHAVLKNLSGSSAVLNHVTLLASRNQPASLTLGSRPEAIRILEQGNYWGRTRSLIAQRKPASDTSGAEPVQSVEPERTASDLVWLAFDREARMSFLVGFLSSERWRGCVETESSPEGTLLKWRMGFDGGDLLLMPGQEIPLEDTIFFIDADPWRLLEEYADKVRGRHAPAFPSTPPVSWCSWYPYRLGVTQERVLENAKIAAERLKPLGFSVMEVDLGWEKGNLPSTFIENERFSKGLAWLAEELHKLGLDLGVWKAPFSISEFDPIAAEHPEWLIHDADGKPASVWEWYWQPKGKVYILDLTHPGARQYLKSQITGLRERGVRYLKADFIGCVSDRLAKIRHDNTMVAGGGYETARIGAQIIREALPEALILNCGGPEMPGTGQWPLLYSCNDTGNTGFISHTAQKDNYLALACHLFKNHRWGVLQPSCLCVGGPGTLEDARMRATIAFLSGGQIDISDTLVTLPEDRWAVLRATLPPLGLTARPVDLFEPLNSPYFSYGGSCRGEDGADPNLSEHPPGSVWHVHVDREWDAWDLAGVMCYNQGASAESPELSRYAIPLPMLGLSASETYWAYEFWSGQFLGEIPGRRVNSEGYAHPGDFQDLKVGGMPGMLDIAFFGPAVKLVCLRQTKPHPWVVGTSFHQSCGTELLDVIWDPDTYILKGRIQRPAGETGYIVLATVGMEPVRYKVGGQNASWRASAHGSIVLNVLTTDSLTPWEITFRKQTT